MPKFGLMCRARSTTVLAHVFMARQKGEGLRRSKRHSRSSLTPLTTKLVRSLQNSVKPADRFYVGILKSNSFRRRVLPNPMLPKLLSTVQKFMGHNQQRGVMTSRHSRKLATLPLSEATRSSKGRRSALNEESFHEMIVLERRRTERSQRPFLLMLLDA